MERKRCPKCGRNRLAKFFAKRRGNKLNSYCKTCQRKVSSEHYSKNTQYYKDKSVARRRELKAFVDKLKEGPCEDCGKRFPIVCMDFDHRPGETKYANVSNMVVKYASKRKLEAELAKCDLVCANCHRIRTQVRANNAT